MNVGFVGLGKLGLPVAQAITSRGHKVIGYDVSEAASDRAKKDGLFVTASIGALVSHAEIVFVAVQTPHEPRYEGITRLPEDRKDFDYSYLRRAIIEVAAAIAVQQSQAIVVVISTVLPGTMEREILPLLGSIPVVYNPSFIAMGTVERDFLHPEFVLLGVDDADAGDTVERFYQETLGHIPVVRTAIRNAELIKVAYNTFIGMKLAFVNTLMEICHKMGCDVDAVTDALKMAHRRLISPAYLSAGMGDGGACHPRDNIALSWMARELGLSFDLFGAIMMQREKQAEWLADLMCEYDLPKAILGMHYKPGTDIETGSHPRLVKTILEERGHHVFQETTEPCVVLIGCKEPKYQHCDYPIGSVIIDPWRFIHGRDDVTVIGIGGAQDRRMSVVR